MSRKYFQLRLRTMLFAMVVICVAGGWLSTQWHDHQREQSVISELVNNRQFTVVNDVHDVNYMPPVTSLPVYL